jgi:CHAT domain-containing protein
VTEKEILLFVLSKSNQAKDPDLNVYRIPISRDELADRVGRFRQMISARSPPYEDYAPILYDLLLKPAERQIQKKSTLCIVPDGILWELPFQAIQPVKERFLIEDYALFYAPSFSVLKELSQRKKENSGASAPSLLAFGNPSLGSEVVAQLKDTTRSASLEPFPDAETEVKALPSFFGSDRSKIFIGPSADEKSFKSLVPKVDVIHCATHGVLDDRNPLYSFLLFSKTPGSVDEEGLLEAREIMQLKLNADLVVLSACETARGKIGAGEGVVGMAWAFFTAGSRASLVSQWKVNSVSTTEWMIDFYRYYKQSPAQKGLTKADAVRHATLKMMTKNTGYRHPFYGAGFILIGNNN